jgi:hypothetical protein
MGWYWEYEPEGYRLDAGWYLPDFRFSTTGKPVEEDKYEWAEIKPSVASITQEEWGKLLEFEQRRNLWLFDGTPALRMYTPPSWHMHDLYDEHGNYAGGQDVHIPRPYKVVKWADDFEREGWAYNAHKDRWWWDWHGNFLDNPGEHPELMTAIKAARQERFGERKNTNGHRLPYAPAPYRV